MLRFKKILFYLNKASTVEAGLDRAARLAANSGAALTFVEVLDGYPREMTMLTPSFSAEELQTLALEEARAQLGWVASLAAQRGVGVDIRILVGEPWQALPAEIVRFDYDLLIVNRPRKESLRERVFGSRLVELMRRSPCPVLALRPESGAGFRRILAAVDLDPGDRARNGTSAAVLETAAALARSEGSDLHIAHFWGLKGEKLLRGRPGVPRYQLIKLLRSAREAAGAAMEDLLRQVDLGAVRPVVHLRKGEPARLIPYFAKYKRAGLVVMGMSVRSGVARFLAPNLTEDVYRAVDCPVVTVNRMNSLMPLRHRAA